MKRHIIQTILLLTGLAALGLFYYSRLPKYTAGAIAPDFSVVVPGDSVLQRSELTGRYVLLHFWGSWCGPCRAENPVLRDLYARLHPLGFDIISIGIERNPNAWRAAIARDGLYWPWHTSAAKQFDEPMARLFNVRSIPTTFLIGPDGKVEGVNLSVEAIAGRVQKR
jgi:thiol-disulfide isomerase/thioredoxin